MTFKEGNKEGFSLAKRAKSFVYAWKGIVYAYKTQHNLWIHSLVAVLVLIAGFIFNISISQWLIVLLCFAMVIAAELFNTSIELLTDLVSPEFNKKAGLVKDLASGAVLIAAIFSAIIGFIIFLPKIFEYL